MRALSLGTASRHLILLSAGLGALSLSSGVSMAAACNGDPPCIERLVEVTAGGKHYIDVHFNGACKFDVFTLWVANRSSVRFTDPSKGHRNELCSSRPFRYGPVQVGQTYSIAISGCVKHIIGKDNCTWPPSPAHTLQIGGAPQTPPARGQWGALAADSKGRWGYAVGYQSEAQARDAAMKGCGSNECKIAIAGQASCIAYYESRTGGYWYGLALHSVRSRAISVARDGCTRGAPAGTCKLVKVECAS